MSELESTRLSLHAVAEMLLAGPQFDQSKTIKLRAVPEGFGTIAAPDVRVQGTSLVIGDLAVPLDGQTLGDVATDAGLSVRSLSDVYADSVNLTAADVLTVDPAHAAKIAEAFRAGQDALVVIAPDVETVLWPEHFDIGVAIDEVNYGVSPGDGYLGVPYAYVGPWSFGSSPESFVDSFWNAPFGAALPLDEIVDLAAFFAEGGGIAKSD